MNMRQAKHRAILLFTLFPPGQSEPQPSIFKTPNSAPCIFGRRSVHCGPALAEILKQPPSTFLIVGFSGPLPGGNPSASFSQVRETGIACHKFFQKGRRITKCDGNGIQAQAHHAHRLAHRGIKATGLARVDLVDPPNVHYCRYRDRDLPPERIARVQSREHLGRVRTGHYRGSNLFPQAVGVRLSCLAASCIAA